MPSQPAPTILISLAAANQRQFFPVGVPDQIAGHPCALLTFDDLSAEEYDRAIREAAPRALITGWGNPSIDREWTTLAGGTIEYVCHTGGGVRHLITREMLADGLLVSNWGPLAAPIVAEFTLMIMIASLRNLRGWLGAPPEFFSHGFHESMELRSIRNENVGIYGFGGIARELIDLLAPFQAPISVFSEGVPPALIENKGARVAESLEVLCTEASVFVCLEALTPRTRGTLDRTTLERLPIGAVFVNVGRGALVDETALAQVARERNLRLACDVFAEEPLPAESELRSLPTAILSPHLAGITNSLTADMGRVAVENCARFFEEGRPQHLVTIEAYDRAT